MSHRRDRRIALVGAATSIGIRPYDEGGGARHLDRAANVLREAGLVARLGAHDLGDVTAPAYRDFTRPPGGIRNEPEVAQYCRSLADRITPAISGRRFALVIGGDCSIVLGALLSARHQGGRVGLVYVDAHADFATPQESITGSAAGMCLALAVGRGDSSLARLADSGPLVRPEDVALIGRRETEEASHCSDDEVARSGILDLRGHLTSGALAPLATAALERVGRPHLDGFWIHVDVDVLNPQVMPAVDSPEPGGPDIDELAALLEQLVHHPRAIGMQLTIYDPALDADGSCASRLITLLEKALWQGLEGANQ